MNWLQLLLLLACPLMMLFCMNGMFTGSKHKHSDLGPLATKRQDLEQLQIKVAELMDENQKYRKELDELKAGYIAAEI